MKQNPFLFLTEIHVVSELAHCSLLNEWKPHWAPGMFTVCVGGCIAEPHALLRGKPSPAFVTTDGGIVVAKHSFLNPTLFLRSDCFLHAFVKYIMGSLPSVLEGKNPTLFFFFFFWK